MSYLTNKEFFVQVAKGNIPGHSIIHKFGHNPAVTNAVWEGVNELSGLFYYPSIATTVRVKAGGNAADTAAGAGAQAITVEGLDETGAAATEDIELAGASVSSSTSTTFIRVFRAFIADDRAGAYGGNNIGDIIVEDTAGVNDMIIITADEGRTQHCSYTIPLGKTGYLLSTIVQSKANKQSNFRLFDRLNILDATTPFPPKRIKFFWAGVVGPTPIKPYIAIEVIPALTDIWIEALGDGAQSEVVADMEIMLVDDGF